MNLFKMALIGLFLSTGLQAQDKKQAADMSDPLAVYSSIGLGVANYGMFVSYGQTYKTAEPGTGGMNLLEFKGWAGDTIGWDRNSKKDSNLDSIRFRNFQSNFNTMSGSQTDIDYNVDRDFGYATYSILKAVPKFGPFYLYPLAGVGVAIQKTTDEGFEFPGMIYAVGMYAKIEITKKIWLNYNPSFYKTLTGSVQFQDDAFGTDEDYQVNHEFVASYQFTPRFNIRYFAGWTDKTDFVDGSHRLQINLQL